MTEHSRSGFCEPAKLSNLLALFAALCWLAVALISTTCSLEKLRTRRVGGSLRSVAKVRAVVGSVVQI